MFDELVIMKKGEIEKYEMASSQLREWTKKFAIPNKKYGPFFEDISTWSNTGINAGRLAEYILQNPQKWGRFMARRMPEKLSISCIDLGNNNWKKYSGVTVTELAI